MLCRVLGDCVYGPPIDLEAGTLLGDGLLKRQEKKLTYVRYDKVLEDMEAREAMERQARRSLATWKLPEHKIATSMTTLRVVICLLASLGAMPAAHAFVFDAGPHPVVVSHFQLSDISLREALAVMPLRNGL